VTRRTLLAAPLAQAAVQAPTVKALVFDVFGTVVDWRGSIISEGAAWNRRTGRNVDWPKLADRWRSGYGPAMDKVRKGVLPWTRIDALHRRIFDELLPEFGLEDLGEDDRVRWNNVWERLRAWPDSVAGLTRLRKRYTTATLSNGNVSLLVNMAKHSGLPWDAVLSAELFHHYKPDREVYLGAADLLGHPPAQVMMVAAHAGDLKAAAACGLRTAFVSRPFEYGPGRARESPASEAFDYTARDLLDLSRQLAA
jgi:2-haloacid dehalogenase